MKRLAFTFVLLLALIVVVLPGPATLRAVTDPE